MHSYGLAYAVVAAVVATLAFYRATLAGSNPGYAALTGALAGLAWIVAVPIYLARALSQALKPRPGCDRRHCPHCGHEFEGTRRYCVGCGGQIWDDVLPDR